MFFYGAMPQMQKKAPKKKFTKPEVPIEKRIEWENYIAEYLGLPTEWRDNELFVYYVETVMHRKLVVKPEEAKEEVKTNG